MIHRAMTEPERLFATNNIEVVYQFLSWYGLNYDEFYDVIIFGYLRAVQIYIDRQDHCFKCIAWNQMKGELSNQFRMMKSKKRAAVVLDIDDVAVAAEDTDFWVNQLMRELMDCLTKRQQDIVKYRIYGYTSEEICRMAKVKKSTYYNELRCISEKCNEVMEEV